MNDPRTLAELLAAAAADPGIDAAAASARRAALLALQRRGQITTPEDRCAAARILLGGSGKDELQAAEALALAAMARLPAARPLAAHAFDRLRQLAGQPQKFGTVADWPVDANTTDSERAKWGVPPRAPGGGR
jgi:hypothetical protein